MRRSSSPSHQKHLQNARGLRYVLMSVSGDGTKWIKEGKHSCNVAPVQFPMYLRFLIHQHLYQKTFPSSGHSLDTHQAPNLQRHQLHSQWLLWRLKMRRLLPCGMEYGSGRYEVKRKVKKVASSLAPHTNKHSVFADLDTSYHQTHPSRSNSSSNNNIP